MLCFEWGLAFRRLRCSRRRGPRRWRGFSSGKKDALVSGPNLFAGLLFSSIGFVGFVYGKRMSAWKPMFLGIA